MANPQPPAKKQKTDSPLYELIYWPSIPGRGEHIRLCFEATSTPYTDVSNADGSAKAVLAQIGGDNLGDASNPPPLAPPILKHGDVLLSQTPNILLYLGEQLGLAGGDDDPLAKYHVNQLALTALDGFSNEVHDTHHPISTGDYYEAQQDAAKAKATDWIGNRMPKFLDYFDRVLQGPASQGGEWLYGGSLTYADLVLFQTLDGVTFAFPEAVKRCREEGKFERVWQLYERVKALEKIKEYFDSNRRTQYSMGIYRHYPELDT